MTLVLFDAVEPAESLVTEVGDMLLRLLDGGESAAFRSSSIISYSRMLKLFTIICHLK